MIKEVAQHIPGVSIYPIISLSVFFLFFVALLIWVIKANKKELQEISEMPLNE